MGFLEEILQRLEANGKNQQENLNAKCKEHSDWLQTELLKINELIIQNPRDNLCLKSKLQNSSIVEHVDDIPAPTALPERNNAQKRKSPEMRLSGTKDSPDQKRCSFSSDWEEIACKAGLPVDLNKLKKEQLLAELESYGIKQFTMKDLKKDLIDALKERLIFDSRNTNTVIQSSNVQPEAENHQQFTDVQTEIDNHNESTDAVEGQVQNESLRIESNHDDDKNTMADDSEEQSEQPVISATSSSPTDDTGCTMDASMVEAVVNTLESFCEDEPMKQSTNNIKSEEGYSTQNEFDSKPKLSLSKDTNQKSRQPSISKAKVSPKNLPNLSTVSTFVPPTNSNANKIPPPKPLIPALEKARVLREAEKLKERARAMKAADEVRQKKMSESINSNNNSAKPSTWGLLKPIKPPSTNVVHPPASANSSKPKVGLIESIFGSKKGVNTTGNSNQSEQNVQNFCVTSEVTLQAVSTSSQPVKSSHESVQVKAVAFYDNQSVKTTVSSEPLREVAIQQHVEHKDPDEYEIEDRDSSGSSCSGTDDEDDKKEKQKKVPEWARGNMLKEALDRQYGGSESKPLDPDVIFHEVQTCSLEEIFGSKAGKSGQYSKRTSSAKWDHDQLSLVEKRTYRSQMGYTNQ